jgi:hypothetical protein
MRQAGSRVDRDMLIAKARALAHQRTRESYRHPVVLYSDGFA